MTAAALRRRLRRWLVHPLEALGAGLVLLLLRLLPVDAASGLGGAVARALGPHLKVSDQGRRNLARALPALDDAAIERVVIDMWDNLGRVVGEYPHLRRLGATRVEIVGAEHLVRLRDDGAPGICFSGHLGNWELLPAIAARHGVRLSNVYRAANNRHVLVAGRTLEKVEKVAATIRRNGGRCSRPRG